MIKKLLIFAMLCMPIATAVASEEAELLRRLDALCQRFPDLCTDADIVSVAQPTTGTNQATVSSRCDCSNRHIPQECAAECPHNNLNWSYDAPTKTPQEKCEGGDVRGTWRQNTCRCPGNSELEEGSCVATGSRAECEAGGAGTWNTRGVNSCDCNEGFVPDKRRGGLMRNIVLTCRSADSGAEGEEETKTPASVTQQQCIDGGGTWRRGGCACRGLRNNWDSATNRCSRAGDDRAACEARILPNERETHACRCDDNGNNCERVRIDVERLQQERDEAEQALAEARAREQSIANRLLTAASIGAIATGASDMMAGQAQAASDDRWARSIENLTQSFRCTIPGQSSLIGGQSGHAPMEPRSIVELRAEYVGTTGRPGLAQRVREMKEVLGLPPGIESQLVIDMGSTYDAIGAMDTTFTGGFDGAVERRDSGAAAARAQRGQNMAVAGVAASVGANVLMNHLIPSIGAGDASRHRRPVGTVTRNRRSTMVTTQVVEQGNKTVETVVVTPDNEPIIIPEELDQAQREAVETRNAEHQTEGGDFARDSSSLTSAGRDRVINAVRESIEKLKGEGFTITQIALHGFGDRYGNDSINQTISDRRAQEVRSALQGARPSLGVSNITAQGHGHVGDCNTRVQKIGGSTEACTTACRDPNSRECHAFHRQVIIMITGESENKNPAEVVGNVMNQVTSSVGNLLPAATNMIPSLMPGQNNSEGTVPNTNLDPQASFQANFNPLPSGSGGFTLMGRQ